MKHCNSITASVSTQKANSQVSPNKTREGMYYITVTMHHVPCTNPTNADQPSGGKGGWVLKEERKANPSPMPPSHLPSEQPPLQPHLLSGSPFREEEKGHQSFLSLYWSCSSSHRFPLAHIWSSFSGAPEKFRSLLITTTSWAQVQPSVCAYLPDWHRLQRHYKGCKDDHGRHTVGRGG